MLEIFLYIKHYSISMQGTGGYVVIDETEYLIKESN